MKVSSDVSSVYISDLEEEDTDQLIASKVMNRQSDFPRTSEVISSNGDKVTISDLAKALALEVIDKQALEADDGSILKELGEEIDVRGLANYDSQSLWEAIKEEALKQIAKMGVKQALTVAIGKFFSGGLTNVLFDPSVANPYDEGQIVRRITDECIECEACLAGGPSACPVGVFDGTLLTE